MTLSVTRVCRLYNIKAREEQPARDGKSAVKARPAQKGIFDAGKTWVFENLLLRDPANPNIPGTPVRRLRTFPLSEKAEAALDDEIARVIRELQEWRAAQLATGAGKPTQIPTQPETVSAPHGGKKAHVGAIPAQHREDYQHANIGRHDQHDRD
jgi:hypothetical protein